MNDEGRSKELRCSVLGATVVKKFGKVEVEQISESAVNDHVAPWVSAGWQLLSTQAVPRPGLQQGVAATDLYFFWER